MAYQNTRVRDFDHDFDRARRVHRIMFAVCAVFIAAIGVFVVFSLFSGNDMSYEYSYKTGNYEYSESYTVK